MGAENKDFFGMPDEEFANVPPVEVVEEEDTTPSATTEETPDKDGEDGDLSPSGSNTDGDSGQDEATATTSEDGAGDDEEKDDTTATEEDPDKKTDASAGAEPGKDKQEANEQPAGKDADPAKTEGKDKAVSADLPQSSEGMSQEQLAGFYDQIMKPFKANSRMVTLRNADEAIRLMQMGAGAARKVMEMQPHLKTLRMLEKNNLLDESKLSFLIDLNQKNPEAIKKLIKDSGIDPLDFNMEDNADYRPTNHSVSDNEIAFTEALKDVTSRDGGRETIAHIQQTWDQKSKDFLFAEPQTLAIIQSQRENGLYDQITAEVERRKLLGEIAPTVPFLEAYKIAGDALVAANALDPKGSKSTSNPTSAVPSTPAQGATTQQPGRVLGTRAAAPKSDTDNNEQVKAAASPSANGRKAKEIPNPLAMADDEFLKTFNGRL